MAQASKQTEAKSVQTTWRQHTCAKAPESRATKKARTPDSVSEFLWQSCFFTVGVRVEPWQSKDNGKETDKEDRKRNKARPSKVHTLQERVFEGT